MRPDIIAPFARHNLTFLDALFLYDNDSVDGTREILVALQREGLAIVIADDPHLAYMQAEKMTALFRNACEYAAPDYAFLLDADEFIVAPSRHALEQDLAQVPKGTAGALGWTTYLYAADESEPDPLRRMVLRRRKERPRYYKIVVKCDPRECQHISIAQGNHDVTHDLLGMLPHHFLSNAHLAHFPVRSATQITSKEIGGWLAYLAKDPEAPKYDAGYQWRHLYERLLDNPVLTFRDLEEMPLNYAQPGQQ